MRSRLRSWLQAPGAGIAAVWAAVLLTGFLVALPLLLGSRTLFLRDVLGLHFPIKSFGAAQLHAGRIPALNPSLGLGQTFRGNPQALAFYPDNLLYLIAPFWSAFNLHFVLHWFLALFAMRALARELGIGMAGSLAAAVTYAMSGWFLSTLSFYNLISVAALWPVVLWGALRSGRRGVIVAGLALGLAILGGEPVTVALGCLPLLALAWQAHGARRGAGITALVILLGVLVALPQIVATARILPFTYRAAHGVSVEEARFYSFHPLRLLELVLPLPFGWPSGPHGWWATRLSPRLPLFFSAYFGIVGVWLALKVARRRALWSGLALAGLVMAFLGGHAGDLLVRLTSGLFRYPEKFLFWMALSVPLLVGWGFETVLQERNTRGLRPAAVTLASLGALILLARSGGAFSPDDAAGSWQSALWAGYLLVAAALLLLGLWAVRRSSAAGLLALQAIALLQLAPLAVSTPTAALSEPSDWARRLGPGGTVLNVAEVHPFWRGPASSVILSTEMLGPTLATTPNVTFGLRYPIASDFEGLASPLQHLLLFNLVRLPWADRLAWFRTLGVQDVVTFEDVSEPGLRPVDALHIGGQDARLYEVANPAPQAWWPASATPMASPLAAMLAVSASRNPVEQVLVSEPLVHRGGGAVELLEESPDRIVLDVKSDGGVAVVRRNFDPLLLARSDAGPLKTVAVNLVLLGVVVPPGEHHVVIEVADWPERLAGLVAAIVVLGALAVLWRSRAAHQGRAPALRSRV